MRYDFTAIPDTDLPRFLELDRKDEAALFVEQ
jgi:hypothetical protein